MQESARRLSAVFFADIVGFTTLTAVDESAAIQMVELLQRLSHEIIEQTYRGRVVKFIGDATLAEFASADAAVRAALALKREYEKAAEAMGATGLLRIAVHLGEVLATADGDIYGDGVNTTSRLEERTRAGNITISEDVWRQLKTRRSFQFTALPPVELRGIDGPIAIYDVKPGEVDEKDGVLPGARPATHGAKSTTFWSKPLASFTGVAAVIAVFLGLGLMYNKKSPPAPNTTSADTSKAQIDTSANTKAGGPVAQGPLAQADAPAKSQVTHADVLPRRVLSNNTEPAPRSSRQTQSDLRNVLDDYARTSGGEIASMQISRMENGVASVNLVLVFKSGENAPTPLPYRAQVVHDGNRWVVDSFARR